MRRNLTRSATAVAGDARHLSLSHGYVTNDCRDVFGAQEANEITGSWIWPLDECRCFSLGSIVGRCPRSQPRVIPPWPLASVCGGDGVTYDSAADACAHNTFPLHGGFCGACSTRHDIDIYNSTRNNLTATTTACALQLLYHGYIHCLCRNSRHDALQVCCGRGLYGQSRRLIAGVHSVLGRQHGMRRCNLQIKLSSRKTHKTTSGRQKWQLECVRLGASLRPFLHSTLPPLRTLKPAHSCLKCDEDFCGDPFIRCAPPPRAPTIAVVCV
jgi:hypothetical protein